jgi:hypothetical protein
VASLKQGLRQIDNRLSIIQSRLNDLRRDRDELEAASRRKRQKPETQEAIRVRIASIDLQIKAAEKGMGRRRRAI